MSRTCIKCGELFTPLQHNQKQCGCCYAEQLAKQRNWSRLDKFFERLGGYEDRVCNICGSAFKPTSPQHRICPSCIVKKNKSRHLWNVFKITHEEYDEMLKNQDGGCAICGTTIPSEGRDSKYFNVDHCHETGKVRALLCTKCNVGLGNFKDSVDNLRKAIDYLIQHGKSNDYPEKEYTQAGGSGRAANLAV